jgi:hypothetical protein
MLVKIETNSTTSHTMYVVRQQKIITISIQENLKPNLSQPIYKYKSKGKGKGTSWPSWQVRLQAVQTPAFP